MGAVPPSCNAEELRPDIYVVDVNSGTPDVDEDRPDGMNLGPVCVAPDVKFCLDEGDDASLCGNPDAEELRTDDVVFHLDRGDLDGKNDGSKEDADTPFWVTLDVEETCPVENGSRVTVSVLLA